MTGSGSSPGVHGSHGQRPLCRQDPQGGDGPQAGGRHQAAPGLRHPGGGDAAIYNQNGRQGRDSVPSQRTLHYQGMVGTTTTFKNKSNC